MTVSFRITPCLWFDTNAEEAARFYVSVFPGSEITAITHYGEAGHEVHQMEAGSVLTVEFTLSGQPFTAMNGGPQFVFNEAISLVVNCETQAEVDFYWEKLTQGGDPEAQQCGWLKDKFGVSWQVVPVELNKLISSADRGRSERAMTALLQMKKLDINKLRSAADNTS